MGEARDLGGKEMMSIQGSLYKRVFRRVGDQLALVRGQDGHCGAFLVRGLEGFNAEKNSHWISRIWSHGTVRLLKALPTRFL